MNRDWNWSFLNQIWRPASIKMQVCWENNAIVSKRLQPTLYHDGHEYICLIYFSLLWLCFLFQNVKPRTFSISPQLCELQQCRILWLCLPLPFISDYIVFSRCVFFSHLEFILRESPSLRKLKKQRVLFSVTFPALLHCNFSVQKPLIVPNSLLQEIENYLLSFQVSTHCYFQSLFLTACRNTPGLLIKHTFFNL